MIPDFSTSVLVTQAAINYYYPILEKRIPLKQTSGQLTWLSASVPDPVPTLAPDSILLESTTLARTADNHRTKDSFTAYTYSRTGELLSPHNVLILILEQELLSPHNEWNLLLGAWGELDESTNN